MRTFQLFSLVLASLTLGGCATYSISEQEMTNYLTDNISFNQSVGVENVLYAQVAIDDLKVNIGRADADRLSVFANTNARYRCLINPAKP